MNENDTTHDDTEDDDLNMAPMPGYSVGLAIERPKPFKPLPTLEGEAARRLLLRHAAGDEAPLERWRNPLTVPQTIKLVIGENRRAQTAKIVVGPGETVTLPARYTNFIHSRQCAETDENWCVNGLCKRLDHAAVVIGGRAPQLVREGSRDTMAQEFAPRAAIAKAPRSPSELSKLTGAGESYESPLMARVRAEKR